MLAFLEGIIISKMLSPTACIISVNGLGLKVHITQRDYLNLIVNSRQHFFTSLIITTESVKIYGFSNSLEQSLFDLINSVKGIGAKTALILLDTFRCEELTQAIICERDDILSKAPSIGQKTAQRIIFELKSKIKKLNFAEESLISENTNFQEYKEARELLISLGYAEMEIDKAIKLNINSNTLIEDCLKHLN